MKDKRQSAIISIINERPIKTHEQLVAELQIRGFNVTQATVSRDIKELCLIKNPEGIYCVSDNFIHDNRYGSFAESVKSIDFAGNIVVVKTKPGTAPAVAAFTDEAISEEILGSIAGDDTIFIAVKDNERTKYVCQRLRSILIKA